MSMEEIPEERPLDPTKLMRIASMVREVLEEARRMQPTPEAAEELALLYGRVKRQLEEALPEFLVDELSSLELDLPFKDGATADEVRMAFSGLIGWMGGLFQGLQASWQAQAAVNQVEGGGGSASLTDLAGGTNGNHPKKQGYL